MISLYKSAGKLVPILFVWNIALLVCVFFDQTNSFFVALLVQYLRKSAYQPYAIVVVLTGCYLAETVEGA